MFQRGIYLFYRAAQCRFVAGLCIYDLFPIPLIDKNRMDIVRDFVAADGVHIGIKPFAGGKAVAAQRKALPFCKRLDDLVFAVDPVDIEPDRAFETVQVIVQTAILCYKQRRGNASQIKLYGNVAFEKILYFFYRDLCLAYVECGGIALRDVYHFLFLCSF